MKKILIIGMTSNIGGMETTILNMYKKLDKHRYQIDFINRSLKKMAFQDYYINNGSKVYQITSYYINSRKYFKELLKILKNNNYDIIYCNFSSARFITPVLCSKFYGKSKIIIHVHNSDTDKSYLIRLKIFINKKILCFLGDYYLSCSHEASKWFYNKKIINSDKYMVIENFIDDKKFTFNNTNRIKNRENFNIKNELVIGHVGKYSKCKNQEFLFKIYHYLKLKNIDAKMILIGNTKNMPFEIDNNIITTGTIDNVDEVLSAVDVFVFPSLYEGFGISLVEAQLLKIPCLASDTIPKETKISNCITYLSLDLGVEVWAEKIIELSKVNKNNIKLSKRKYNNLKKITNIFDNC